LVADISINVVWHLDVPDYLGYMLSAWWLAAAGAMAFCVHAHARARPLLAAALALVPIVSALGAQPNVLVRSRHRDHLARVLAEQVLREAPKHAIVLAQSDLFGGSLFYLQEAERQRPDVVVLAFGLASSSWHWKHVYRLHPDLVQIPLQGPGGSVGRVQRLLAANPQRGLLVERLGLATALKLPACAGGLFLRAGTACSQPRSPDLAIPRLLARNLAQLGEGSPSAAGALASVACQLGESWWRLGYASGAHAALLSGVPKAMQVPGTVSAAQLDRATALQQDLPGWQRGAALGDPARNLFVAGAILDAAGLAQQSRRYLRAAADDGLPEAVTLLHSAR
jgi:hypothetical protein